MAVFITNWALQSYLDLKCRGVFTEEEYLTKLRPDAESLKNYPIDPKFRNSKFWGPGKDQSGRIIADGFKMKWHNIGPGRVQLRLLVVIYGGDAYLCDAYVKDDKTDRRKMAALKNRVRDIHKEAIVVRGEL